MFSLLIFFGALAIVSPAYGAITIRPMLNTGLVGYWAMDEGAGNKAYDQSGNRNTGTASGSPTWADGKLGKALSFNGSGDYVYIADPFHVNQLTVSVWIWRDPADSGGGNWPPFVSKWGGSQYEWTIGMQSGNYAFWIGGPSPSISFDTAIPVPKGQWLLVTMTYDGSHFYAYENTTRIVSQDSTGNINNSNGNLNFARNDVQASYFKGLIDEVRIYNRALSAGEITRLYNLIKPKIKASNDTGLVGYWSFEEGAGTKAGDFSGKGNHGTLTSMDEATDWVAGKRGRALDFDGSNDRVNIADHATLQSDYLTIAAWIRNTGSGWRTVAAKSDGGITNAFWFGSSDSNKLLLKFNGVGGSPYGATTNLNDSAWHHVAGTYDGSFIRVYVDGKLDNTPYAHSGITNKSGTLQIGGNDYWACCLWPGDIDEVRVYNRALSATEVANLYGASKKIMKVNTSQNLKLTTGLVGMWSFNGPDISGATALDRSGQGNNGTISGAVLDSGKVGQALKFNGTSDYVDLGSSQIISSTTPFTVSYWANLLAISDYKIPITLRTNSSQNWRQFWTLSDNSVYFGSNSGWVNLKGALSGSFMGQWHHIVVTYNGSGATTAANFSIYDNGISLSTSDGGSFTGDTGTSRIGVLSNGTSWPWNGKIDEVRIYNRVLSDAEVKRLYQMGK